MFKDAVWIVNLGVLKMHSAKEKPHKTIGVYQTTIRVKVVLL